MLAGMNGGTILLIYCAITCIPIFIGAIASFAHGFFVGVVGIVLTVVDFLFSLFCHNLVMYGLAWLSVEFNLTVNHFSAFAVLAIILLMRAPKISSLFDSKEK